MSDFDRLLNSLQQTGYHQWMKGEGIPVAVGHGMEDVRDINTSTNPARHIALRYSGRIHPTGFQLAAKLHEDGTTTSLKKGGTMIEYDDDDPAIRRRFEAELKKAGMCSDMPKVSYA